jgi:hypothetical protein
MVCFAHHEGGSTLVTSGGVCAEAALQMALTRIQTIAAVIGSRNRSHLSEIRIGSFTTTSILAAKASQRFIDHFARQVTRLKPGAKGRTQIIQALTLLSKSAHAPDEQIDLGSAQFFTERRHSGSATSDN